MVGGFGAKSGNGNLRERDENRPRGPNVSAVRRVEREDQRRAGFLVEVEVSARLPRIFDVLADVGARVGAAVGRGFESPAVQEVVLDELQVGVEAERLVVDVALPARTG